MRAAEQVPAQHQVVTRSPGHLINNNTALWACGPPATGYWGWILFNKIRLIYSHIWQAHAPCILSTLGQTSCLAPIIPTVHHMHVPVHVCHPGFWANPSKMKSFVDVPRHFLCFWPIHKLLSGANCKSTPGEGADGTSLMQILSRTLWGGPCGPGRALNCHKLRH